jgi:putative transport protein
MVGTMVKILIDNPLLLVFLVAAVGYPLGRLKFFGMSLGVGAVLFVGIAVGSLHPDLKAPEIVYVLGQALFVYTVGLAAGPAFVTSFRRDGMRNNLLVAGALVGAGVICVALQHVLHLHPGVAAGMFAGSLTTSPALAAVLETIKQTAAPELMDQLLAEPVVGFSVTYPLGVIGVVLAISLAQRLWKVDYQAEAAKYRGTGDDTAKNVTCTLKIQNLQPPGSTVAELGKLHGWSVLLGRIKRGDEFFMATPHTKLENGDLVMAVGDPDELAQVAIAFGERRRGIRVDRTEYEYRRIFVSNPGVVGRTIGQLNLTERFGEVVTEVRRGDDEFQPNAEMVLELGDIVRVLTHRDHMDEVSAFFGDSYRKVSEVDIMTFSFGLVLGMCVGLIPFPFPGGGVLKLGFAGGPLVVALILGTYGRVGGMVWTLPYSVNMTVRQIGLVLFLASIGTRAGYTFIQTLSRGGGPVIFLSGALITFFASFSVLWIGYRLMKIPMSFLTGMVAGMHTQIAVLGFAKDQTGNDYPDQGYASVYPIATIGKIILVHLIVSAPW